MYLVCIVSHDRCTWYTRVIVHLCRRIINSFVYVFVFEICTLVLSKTNYV